MPRTHGYPFGPIAHAYARVAGSSGEGKKGAMLAVGTSREDAANLVNLPASRGRVVLAAHNSPASVTLSGDADAVMSAKKVFDEDKKFTRLLKVDTAYHSHHMLPCGDPYVRALRDCGVKVIRERPADAPAWFSSVFPSRKQVEASEELEAVYWRDNMCNAVLFSEAVGNALAGIEGLNLALEIGPHPALKGPVSQNVAEVEMPPLPYAGLLGRGRDDAEAFSDALGLLWTHFPRLVRFEALQDAMNGKDAEARRPRLVTGLPKYRWNHARSHWAESRISRRKRLCKNAPHEILGFESPDSNPHDMRWSNVLKQSEVPWLRGHRLQGQAVFPAAGYVAMALEASRFLAGEGKAVRLFELRDLVIPRAITFEEEDDEGVETLVALTAARRSDGDVTAEFACYSTPVKTPGSHHDMDLMARGTVKVTFGTPDAAALSCSPPEEYNMAKVDGGRFYASLAELGYGYDGPFRAMSTMRRRLNQSAALVNSYPYTEADQSRYMIHPSTLDVAFQASILAYSAPEDGRLWSLSVPTSIGAVRLNPHACAPQPLSESSQLPVYATVEDSSSGSFAGNMDVFDPDGRHAMIQVEDLTIGTFAPATEVDDRVMYTQTELGPYSPNCETVVGDLRPSASEVELATVCERIAHYYIHKWKKAIGHVDQQHWGNFVSWANEVFPHVSCGRDPTINHEWSRDTPEEIQVLVDKYTEESLDVRMLRAMDEKLVAALGGEKNMLEHMLLDNTLDDWYEKGLGSEHCNSLLGGVMAQLVHRYPHARIFEIGARSDSVTKAILRSVGDRFSSYTYTDASAESLSKTKELFRSPHGSRVLFEVFDGEKTPESQGYSAHSYDVVVLSTVLHLIRSIHRTLVNARKLLRPGGYLLMRVITGQTPVRYHAVARCLPAWTRGDRELTPSARTAEWGYSPRMAGFGGVDAITTDVDGLAWPMSVIASQAVDDKIAFLRQPLSPPPSSSDDRVRISSLVILGRKTPQTQDLSEKLCEHLTRFCGKVTVLDGLPTEAEASRLKVGSVFVNLVDLETPIFETVTEATMDGLKRMLELSTSVFWVTRGVRMDQPYHAASAAFMRPLRFEEAHISFNHIDVEDLRPDGASHKAIAEYILRQSALNEWDAPPSALADPVHRRAGFLWSREYEVFADRNGRLEIPRVVKDEERNSRLNASRRVVTKMLPASESAYDIVSSSGDSPAVVVTENKPASRKFEPENAISTGTSAVRVISSGLVALNVATDTFLFLAIGKEKNSTDLETAVPQVCLSASNSSELRPFASVLAPLITREEAGNEIDGLLVSVASELVAEALMSRVAQGSRVLVHVSARDAVLVSALERRAAASGIQVSFSCDLRDSQKPSVAGSPSWIHVDDRASSHSLRRTLRLTRPTQFVDLSSNDGNSLGTLVAQAVPSSCTSIEGGTLFRCQSSLPSFCDRFVLANRLSCAVSRARSSEKQKDVGVVDFSSMRLLGKPNPTSGVRWPVDGDVEVEVRPLSGHNLFSRDKTYLLVGLTGRLGQSLAEWMVSNGAGYIVLASRRPDVDERWLASFRGSGATVKVMAVDVLDKERLRTAVRDIRTTCPSIGGVANGAMVLRDSLFFNMSAEMMRDVLAPKIDGSRNLDDVFEDDDLDFFVLFSSSAYVFGNSGQSNYSAANGFLHALARQRRRRGLAASVLDIGRVVGVGYVDAASEVVVEQLKKIKMVTVSEVDLRQAFAETILAGRPVAAEDGTEMPRVTVTTGIRTIRDDEITKGPFFVNSIFSHMVVESNNGATEAEAGGVPGAGDLSVAQRIAQAAGKQEALAVLQEAFSIRLRATLQMDGNSEAFDENTPLVQLGMDSLMAVEARSWFLKELKVDVPVLKVVGGASLAELCTTALEKLNADE